MSGFKKEHPNFTLSLKIADTKEIVQSVLQGNVELGMTGAKLNHSGLQYEKYKEDEMIIIGPSDHPLVKKRRVNFEDLSRELWIIREEGSGTQRAVEIALKKKGWSLKQLNVVMEMGSTSSVKEGVKARLGFAFISKRAVEEELNLGLLSRIDTERIEPIVRQLYILYHRGRTLSPMGRQFLRFLKKTKEEMN